MKWRILGVLFVGLLALILFWDWNWFRGIAERQASAKAGRPITIGHLDVKLGREPVILLDRLVIGNPPDVQVRQPMMQIDRLAVQIDVLKLLQGTLRMPAVTVDHPDGWLERVASGKANWEFTQNSGKPASAPASSFPDIGTLTINNGTVRFIDPKLKTDENLTIRTVPDPKGGEAIIAIDGKGSYGQANETFRFRGGSVLSLRDQNKPYPLDVVASFGDTETHLKGTIKGLTTLSGFEADVELSGPDLASLYPLTGIALPPTPPYDLRGDLTFVGHVFQFHKFAGTLGSSDLEGDLSFEPAHDDHVRPMLVADLKSRKIALADLRGFIGAPPGKADAANAPAERKKEAVSEERSGRLLPTTTLDFEKLHAMDADVHYHGDRIDSDYTPLDNVDGRIKLTDGRLQVIPLAFGVGTGTIKLDVDIDSAVDPARVNADADFRQVDFSRLMKGTKAFDGVGKIGGSAILKTRGNSMAQMFATGDGNLQLFMGHGEISQLLVAIGKIDILQTLGLVSKVQPADLPNGNTNVRCLIDDMSLQQGVLKINTFVLDTTSTNFGLSGSANMRDESLDMIFTPHPKSAGVLTYRPPIVIKGTFASPSVYPEPVETSARIGASVALGIIATPLGALLPSITLGLGEDADCVNLIKTAQAGAASNDSHSSAAQAEKAAKPHPKVPVDPAKSVSTAASH